MWKVILTEEFENWLEQQDDALQEKILTHLGLLKMYGPELSRPYADTVKGSQFPNLKELRIQHGGKPIRAFYAFDPLRQAIILCAGDKSNRKRFYSFMVSVADEVYRSHLARLEKTQ